MDVIQLRTLILNTVKHLSNCELISDEGLYDELKKYIEQVNDETFEKDFQSIEASCYLLKTITKTSTDNDQKQTLMEDFKQESEILLQSLRIYTKMKEYPYTPLQILLKLELLFDPILDHSKICHDTNFELSKSINKTTTEEIIESKNDMNDKKRSILLRELTDAILDDIITFLSKHNKTFYDFYNHDRINYVAFRLRNLSSHAEPSNNIYDKLCFFIDRELKQKYQLDIESLIRLLLDQFESIGDGQYRKKLTDFVENVYSNAINIHKDQHSESKITEFHDHFGGHLFTFVKFFDYIQEDPVVTENDQSTFTTLFEIYCKKLAKILPSAPWKPLCERVSSYQADDSQSTKNVRYRHGNRRQQRGNNHSIGGRQGKFSRCDARGNSMFQDAQDSYSENQYYRSTMTPGHSSRIYDNWRCTSNNPQYHDRWNYYGNSYVHQPW